jgi:DNA-binding SARP family transcriptional activator
MAIAPLEPSSQRLYQLSILGPVRLCRDGIVLEIDRWQRPSLNLLKLLATGPEKRRLRDDLIDILWPDSSPAAGASNLRYTVHRLRRDLGSGEPSPLLSGGGWIALNQACAWEVDLDRFRELAAAEEPDALEAAATLCRGEPLTENRYDDWAAALRSEIGRTLRDVYLRLARLCWEQGLQGRTIAWLERLLAADPLDEEAVQELLRRCAAMGRRAEALQRYRLFEKQLAHEIGVRPLPETVALVESLESDADLAPAGEEVRTAESRTEYLPVIPTYPLRLPGRLVGRESEVAGILRRLERSDAAEPGLALIAAEAGVGKTRLLAELARRARTDGVLTLAGGCYEQEARLPYGPIHDALLDFVRAQPADVMGRELGSLLPALTRIIPELGESGDADEAATTPADGRRLQLFSAAAQTFERIARGRPLLLLLDDLQWADDASLQLVHFLLRQPQLARLLVVGTYREEEVAGGLALVPEAEEQRVHIRLEPLDRSDLSLMLEDRLGRSCAPALTEAIHVRSGGNPFFALQMIDLLQQEGQLEASDDGLRLATGKIELPTAVREAVSRRLRYLDRDEREALALGAILGREFGYAPLEALWRKDERLLFDVLDTAAGRRIVAETEAGYAFRHPLLWEVVYQRTPAPRRALLHERAARVLERLHGARAPDHAAALALHFLAAGERHRSRALPYLILAGDQAERAFAHADAERQYRLALDLAGQREDGFGEAEIREKLGTTLTTLARFDEALELLEQAARIYEHEDDTESLCRTLTRIARVHRETGRLEEGRRRLKPLLERIRRGESAGISAETEAALHLVLAHVCFATGQYEESQAAAERAAQLARAAGTMWILSEAEVRQGTNLAYASTGHTDEGLALVEHGAELAESAGNLDALSLALANASGIYEERGDFDRCLQYRQRSVTVAERLGDANRLAWAQSLLGSSYLHTGRWREARGVATRALDLFTEIGASWHVAYPLSALATIALHTGDLEEASRLFERSMAIAESHGDTQMIALTGRGVGDVDLLRGSPDAACRRLSALADRFDSYDRGLLILSASFAEAHVDLGEWDAAAVIIERWIPRADAGDRISLINLLRVQGRLLAALGRCDEAEGCLVRSAELAHTMPHPLGEGRALAALGDLYARNGDPIRARQALDRALAILVPMGAEPHVARAEAVLEGLS